MTISYQLYSSRNFSPLPDTLRMLADAGYGAVEGWGGMFADLSDAAPLKDALDAAGLTMTSAHIGLDTAAREADRLIPILRDLGTESVFVPAVPPEERSHNAEGWETLGRRLLEASKPYRHAGMNFGWHNHDFEFADLSVAEKPLELILQEGLDWEIDVAWVVKGGEEPMAWIDRYADRIRAVHVKDIAPEGEKADEDGWADPGTGTMDWAALAARLSQLDVAHWVMEHDNPSDDARFARAGMDAARRIEGLPA